MIFRRYTGILSGICTVLALPFLLDLRYVWSGLDVTTTVKDKTVNQTISSSSSSSSSSSLPPSNADNEVAQSFLHQEVLLENLAAVSETPVNPETTSSSSSFTTTIHQNEQVKRDTTLPTTTDVNKVSNQGDQEAFRIQIRLESAPTWSTLPTWAQDYIIWHNNVRRQFPDTALLTDPNAPNIFIQMCQGDLCGGTFDRLGRVENSMAFASLTRRVLLLAWHEPYPLEEFVQPHLINWTAPTVSQFQTEYILQNQIPDLKHVVIDNPWNPKKGHVHTWIQQVGKENEKILYSFKSLPGTSAVPYNQLDLNDRKVTGAIYQSLFNPSAAVQAQLDQIYHELDIQPGNYSAAHCRVRHPGFFGYKAQGKTNGTDADASGLLFEGVFKKKATEAALMGVKCTTRLLRDNHEPIYFLSDSEELVEYVVNGKGRSTTMAAPNQTQGVDVLMANVTQSVRVVSRNVTGIPTLHINRQRGFPVEYYLPTFVDLYIAVNARCVSFGVGNFGMLATKISGTTCRQEHNFMASPSWAKKFQQDRGGTPKCHLPAVP